MQRVSAFHAYCSLVTSPERPLKVYGSTTKLRADLRTRIRTGEEELTGQLERAREEIKHLPRPARPSIHPERPKERGRLGLAELLKSGSRILPLLEIEQSVRRWESGNHQLLRKRIGMDQANALLPAERRKSWGSRDDADDCAEDCQRRITRELTALRGVLDGLPQSRPTSIGSPE